MFVPSVVRRSGIVLITTTALCAAVASPALAASPVSKATAQTVNIGILSGAANVAASASPTTSTNDGTGSNAATSVSPALSLLSGQAFLGAGALQETTQASKTGTSYGCSGVLSPGSSISVGTTGTTCTATGNGTGGVTIDLKQVPALGLALTPFAQVKLTVDSVIAHASDANGAITRGASVANLKLTACLLVCLSPTTVPITLAGTPNENLLTAIVGSLTGQGGVLATLVDVLSNTVAPLVTLTSNYQPAITGGVASVSAIHIGLIGGTAATADLAHVTVGPNAAPAAVSTISSQGVPLILAVLAVLAVAGFLIRRSRLARPTAL